MPQSRSDLPSATSLQSPADDFGAPSPRFIALVMRTPAGAFGRSGAATGLGSHSPDAASLAPAGRYNTLNPRGGKSYSIAIGFSSPIVTFAVPRFASVIVLRQKTYVAPFPARRTRMSTALSASLT